MMRNGRPLARLARIYQKAKGPALVVVIVAAVLGVAGCEQSAPSGPEPAATTTGVASADTVAPTATLPTPQATTPPAPSTRPSVAAAPTVAPRSTPTPTSAATPTPIPTVKEFFLDLAEPDGTEVITTSTAIRIRGRTRADAVVTINDTIVEPDIGGAFQHEVPLGAGVNTIEIVASVASGEQDGIVLTVVVVPG